jgi:hypothetical protein
MRRAHSFRVAAGWALVACAAGGIAYTAGVLQHSSKMGAGRLRGGRQGATAPPAPPAQGFAPGNPNLMHAQDTCQARMLLDNPASWQWKGRQDAAEVEERVDAPPTICSQMPWIGTLRSRARTAVQRSHTLSTAALQMLLAFREYKAKIVELLGIAKTE